MKNFISKSALFLLYIFGGSYLGLLAMVVLQYPVEMLFENIHMDVYYVVSMDLVMLASTALYAYRVGYKDNTGYENVSAPKTAAMIGCACAVFVLFAVLFSFGHPHTINSVFLTYLILGEDASWNLTIVTAAEQYSGLLLAATVLHTSLCGGGMLAGYLLGGKKRLADRRELTGQE